MDDQFLKNEFDHLPSKYCIDLKSTQKLFQVQSVIYFTKHEKTVQTSLIFKLKNLVFNFDYTIDSVSANSQIKNIKFIHKTKTKEINFPQETNHLIQGPLESFFGFLNFYFFEKPQQEKLKYSYVQLESGLHLVKYEVNKVVTVYTKKIEDTKNINYDFKKDSKICEFEILNTYPQLEIQLQAFIHKLPAFSFFATSRDSF